jgi:hypothetical protein
MSEFLGMALYTKDEIGSAISNYLVRSGNADEVLKSCVRDAEKNWTPSWWDKLWGVTTLYDKYKGCATWGDYAKWLSSEGYMVFTEEQKEIIKVFTYESMFTFNTSLLESTYKQVKNLTNGGKDCYLNPSQAQFVNYFKSEV